MFKEDEDSFGEKESFQITIDDVRSPITVDDVSLPAIPRIGDDQQTPWLGFHLFHHRVQEKEVDVVQECVPISGHSSGDHGVTAHSPDCDAPIR